MDEIDLHHSHPHLLADLLQTGGRTAWRAEDSGEILRHQLASPLATDLTPAGAHGDAARRQLAEHPSIETWQDLLLHSQPPTELLALGKDFGKSAAADGTLPQEVAMVLYYGCLLAALVRRGTRITRLGDASLRQAARRVLGWPWLDPRLRPLFDQAMPLLHG